MKNHFDFDYNRINQTTKNAIGSVEICQNMLYYLSDSSVPLIEINDDLCITNSKYSFWSTIEYEFKIDIEPCDILEILNGIIQALVENYTISKIAFQKSFEKHYEIKREDEKIHAVQLGKTSWKNKKAIKTKKSHDKIGRMVSIQPFTENAWGKLLQDAVSIRTYPCFYKDKYRYVIVNKQSGTVFGISCSGTKFLSKKYANKYEIEVEYWSNLMPMGMHHRFDEANEKELYSIIEEVEKYLTQRKIYWKFPGVKKNDWLRTLY